MPDTVERWLSKALARDGPLAHVHNGVIGHDGQRMHYYRRKGTGCAGGCPGFPIGEAGDLLKASQVGPTSGAFRAEDVHGLVGDGGAWVELVLASAAPPQASANGGARRLVLTSAATWLDGVQVEAVPFEMEGPEATIRVSVRHLRDALSIMRGEVARFLVNERTLFLRDDYALAVLQLGPQDVRGE